MTDAPESTVTERPSIALTTPFLSLAAAVIALAAFLLGYVVKDLGSPDHVRRPEFSHARIQESGPGPRALPQRGLDNVTAGTVTKVDGNTVTLEGPNGKSVKVTLGKDTFLVVRGAEK